MRSWTLWLAAVAATFCLVATGTSLSALAVHGEHQLGCVTPVPPTPTRDPLLPSIPPDPNPRNGIDPAPQTPTIDENQELCPTPTPTRDPLLPSIPPDPNPRNGIDPAPQTPVPGTSTPTPLAVSGPVQAQTCAPVASLPADVNPPERPFHTGVDVIARFNFARQLEGCQVALSLDPAAYDAASPEQQTLMLVNAERRDRGLPTVQLDTTLLSRIAFNHSNEMVQYRYGGPMAPSPHLSAINQPGGKNDPAARLYVNPAISGHATCAGEIIFLSEWGGPRPRGVATPGQAILWAMYQDSPSEWVHRQTILGYWCGNPPPLGQHFNWLGVGIALATDTDGRSHISYTLDFLGDAGAATPYTPPATADTTPPTMDPPTIVDTNTVQVTNVRDDSDDGTQVVGVFTVVFYLDRAVDQSGNFRTVAASEDPTMGRIWRASLAATDPTTVHAVAVDGSGNYTDLAGSR